MINPVVLDRFVIISYLDMIYKVHIELKRTDVVIH